MSAIADVRVRFGLVGIVNTLVDLVLFTALSVLGVGLVVANLVSTTAGMACSFLLNRGFTFRASGDPVRQAVLFAAVNVVNLWVLHPLVIAGVAALLPQVPAVIEAAVPKAVAIAAGLVGTYLLYSRVVFRPPSEAAR